MLEQAIGRVGWYLNRLRCMTAVEIPYRVARALTARAERWGLYGGEAITVHMDGGDARVEFGPGDQVTLVGPATFVATIEVEI